MKKQTAYIIINKKQYTEFMRAADVFEPFKFVGYIVRINEIPDNYDTPEELLRLLTTSIGADSISKITGNQDTAVGVIIPGKGGANLKNFSVISNGKSWATMEKLSYALENNMEAQVKAGGFELVVQS